MLKKIQPISVKIFEYNLNSPRYFFWLTEEIDTVVDVDTYVVGAGYDYGAYSFGATYFNSEEDASGDELDRYTVGASYTFGPGMKFNGSVALFDENDTAGGNDATVVAIGTDIQF